jgi:hypothetical protein
MNYYRFSKRRFLETFVNEGVISFSNSRQYRDGTALTQAQRDDEEGRSFGARPKDGTLRLEPEDGSPPILAKSVVHIDIRLAVPVCYLLCLTKCYDPNRYADYDADACVEMRDIRQFMDRLKQQVSRTMHGWSVGATSVEYFNPNFPLTNSDLFRLICSKDNHYEWQAEYRVVLYNPDDPGSVDRIEVNIGPLTDICRIVSRP